MSNEIRERDHEWVKAFHSNFDRLLALLEKLLEKRQPSAYGDELLTDKEVAYLLKVSRRTLQDYRNNGILPYTQVGGKILYRASDIEKTLMKGRKEYTRILIFLEGAQLTACPFYLCFYKIAFQNDKITAYRIGPYLNQSICCFIFFF